ncbi:MAG: response regulator transcription factor [Cyclobacteriaceae bacterium]|nr:response regulator transcription factor [Cyclobacteriaceae bacterium]
MIDQQRPIRCLAVDDEPFALKLISGDIAKIPFLELVGVCAGPKEAAAILATKPVDLMFLDIHMPGLNGTQFLRTLRNPPLVIFTTAYDQYAVEGFDLDVTDYLMKPIPFERFLKAVHKAQARLKAIQGEDTADPREIFFFVKSEYRDIRIFFEDILYVEGLKDYVKIFLEGHPHPILTRMNLKAIEKKLPQERFSRIHNSYIIPHFRVTAFQRTQVFIGDKPIPVGEKYAQAFKERYKPFE